MYDILKDRGPLNPAEIHQKYTEEVDDPRTQRTVRDYLSKMAQYNFVEARVPAGTVTTVLWSRLASKSSTKIALPQNTGLRDQLSRLLNQQNEQYPICW